MRRGRALTGRESLWDSRRAAPEGQIRAGQVMVKDPEVLASVCSREGKAEPVPLWAGGGEHGRMWLWEYPVLCFGCCSVPEEAGAPHGSCCVPRDRELKVPAALVLQSDFSFTLTYPCYLISAVGCLRPTICLISTFFRVICIYFASSPEANGFRRVEEIEDGQQPYECQRGCRVGRAKQEEDELLYWAGGR